MQTWGKGDPIEALFLASCNAFYYEYNIANFARRMRQCKLFVICGYHGTAPAGSDTDTKIVKKFFEGMDKGKSVIKAWKYGNNQVTDAHTWGLLSYGGTDANKNFKLPGWGTNSGISRSKPIWYAQQDSYYQVDMKSRSSEFHKIPYQINVAQEAAPLAIEKFGAVREITSQKGYTEAIYRDDIFKEMDENTLQGMAENALSTLCTDKNILNTIPMIQPVTVREVGEDALGEKMTMAGDVVYEHRINGVPIEDNFIRICMDKDGVHSVINKWREATVIDEQPDADMFGIIPVDSAKDRIPYSDDKTIVRASYCYVNTGNGIYTLSHKIELTDGYEYLVDTRTGKVLS